MGVKKVLELGYKAYKQYKFDKKFMKEVVKPKLKKAEKYGDAINDHFYKKSKITGKKVLNVYKEDKAFYKTRLKDAKKDLKKETSRVKKRSHYSKKDREKYLRYDTERVAESRKKFKDASKKLNEERFFQFKGAVKFSPTARKVKKVAKKTLGPAVGAGTAAALYENKKRGGMINVNRGDGAAIRGRTKGRIL